MTQAITSDRRSALVTATLDLLQAVTAEDRTGGVTAATSEAAEANDEAWMQLLDDELQERHEAAAGVPGGTTKASIPLPV